MADNDIKKIEHDLKSKRKENDWKKTADALEKSFKLFEKKLSPEDVIDQNVIDNLRMFVSNLPNSVDEYNIEQKKFNNYKKYYQQKNRTKEAKFPARYYRSLDTLFKKVEDAFKKKEDYAKHVETSVQEERNRLEAEKSGSIVRDMMGLEQGGSVKTAAKNKILKGMGFDPNDPEKPSIAKVAKRGFGLALGGLIHLAGAAFDAPALNMLGSWYNDKYKSSIEKKAKAKFELRKMDLEREYNNEMLDNMLANGIKDNRDLQKARGQHYKQLNLIKAKEDNTTKARKVESKDSNKENKIYSKAEKNVGTGTRKVKNKVTPAGDGSFVTNGPTLMMVGDNPGGKELVETNVTPLSGKGKTKTSGGVIKAAGGISLKSGKNSNIEVASKLKSLINLISKDDKSIISILKEQTDVLSGISNTLGVQLDLTKDEALKYKRSTIGNKDMNPPGAIKPEKEEDKKKSLLEKLSESLVKPLINKIIPKTAAAKMKVAGGVAGGAIGAYGGYKAGGWLKKKAEESGLVEEGGFGGKAIQYGTTALGAVGGAVGGAKLAGKFASSKMGQKLASKIPGIGGLVGSAASQAMADQSVYVTNADEIGQACAGGGTGLGSLIPSAKGKGKAKLPIGGGKGNGIDGLAKSIGSGIGSIGKGIGEALGGFLQGLAKGLESLGSSSAMKGAVTLGIIGGALWLSGKGFKEFQELDWEAIGKGAVGLGILSVAVAGLGSIGPMALVGAASVAALGGALWLAGKGFKEFQELDWETIAKGTVAVGALALGAAALSPLAPAIGIGALALGGLGLALRAFPVDRLVAIGDIFPKVGLAIKSALDGVSNIIEKIGMAIQSAGTAIATAAPAMANAIKTMSETGNPLKLIGLAGALAILTPALIGFAGAAAVVGAASKGIDTIKSLFGFGSSTPQTSPTEKTPAAAPTQKTPAASNVPVAQKKEEKKSFWGGWFATGGTFDIDQPTLLGVGEKGQERVQIVPTKLKEVASTPNTSFEDVGDEGFFVSDEQESLMKQQMQVFSGKEAINVIIVDDLSRKEAQSEHKIGEPKIISTPAGDIPVPEVIPGAGGPMDIIKGFFGAPGGGGGGPAPRLNISAAPSPSMPSFSGTPGGGSKPSPAVGSAGMPAPPKLGTPGPVGDAGSGPSPMGQSGGGAGPIPAAGGFSKIVTKSGKSATVATQYAQQFQGFINDMEATGYQIKSLGGYANRNMVGGNKPSYHALGAAIDINPAQNPYYKEDGRPLQTDMPSNTGAIAARHGLGWGGNWHTIKDAMHFSVAKGEGGSVALSRSSAMPAMASAPAKGSGGGGGGGGSSAGSSAGGSTSSAAVPAPAKNVQTTAKSGAGGGSVASASKASYDMDSKNSATIAKTNDSAGSAQASAPVVINNSNVQQAGNKSSGAIFTGDNTSFPARLSRLYS